MTTRSLAVLVLLAAACAHSGGSGDTTAAARPAPASATAASRQAPTTSGMPMCPTDVEGTQVTAADTPTGETVTFTTAPERAAELRTRVHAMADMHNRHHATGTTDARDGMQGAGGGGMHGGMMMPPPSRATVEDTDTGARIVVTPNDPADLAKLQATVREHAQHMQEGCGHMGHMGGHMGAPPR